MSRHKDEFERLASLFPFFWFANTFIKCTGAVVASKSGISNNNSEANDYLVAGNWINYGVDMLLGINACIPRKVFMFTFYAFV